MASKQRSTGDSILIWIDRWLVHISAGIVAGVWLTSDILGFHISQGTQAALASFVGYAWFKTKADNRWRALELEADQMTALIAALEKYEPGSREAIAVRKELLMLAKRAQTSEEEGDQDDNK